MRWHRGGWKCKRRPFISRRLEGRFGFNHRISFESSKEFKAGLEDKNVIGSYKQAQEYFRKANETYEAIMVGKRCICFARWDTEFISSLSRSNLPWACIINDQVRG